MPEPKWEIIPLKGRYCHNCVEALTKFRVRTHSILPMCAEDLDQFLRNGDIGIVELLIKKTEEEMLQQIEEIHKLDDSGKPAGGTTTGMGLVIEWQDGPLGRGPQRIEPNGAFVETVMQAAIGRLNFYQGTDFRCRENAVALTHLETALLWLQKRTMDREARQVEGTHAK